MTNAQIIGFALSFLRANFDEALEDMAQLYSVVGVDENRVTALEAKWENLTEGMN